MFFTAAGLQRLQRFESSGNPSTPPYNWSHPGSNSTASGLYGFTDTTWRDFAPASVLQQYPHAYLAPADVQTQVAAITPTSHWTCPGCDAGANALVQNPQFVSDTPSAGVSDPFGAGGINTSLPSFNDFGTGTSTQFAPGTDGMSSGLPVIGTPGSGGILSGGSSGDFLQPQNDMTFDPNSGLFSPSGTQFASGLTPGGAVAAGGGSVGDSLGALAPGAPGTGLPNPAGIGGSATDFWTNLFQKIQNVMSRVGLILVGVVIIGVGAYAAAHGEFGAGAQKLMRGAK